MAKITTQRTEKKLSLVRKKRVQSKIAKSNIQKVPKTKIHKNKLLNTLNTNNTVTNIDSNQIRNGINALLKYVEKTKTKALFDEEQAIFLQLECIKIPPETSRILRLKLKHTLVTEQSEVCLIVSDLKKGRKIDHDPTIEHYVQILRTQNITNVKQIIPLHQIKVEYDQFELKRRLLTQFDYFLADGKIIGHLTHLLGKIFLNSGKKVTPVKMESRDLKSAIDNALLKTAMNLHGKGNTFTAQVGHSKMPSDDLFENAMKLIDELDIKFPGGLQNVRALHVKTHKSLAVPLYLTLKSSNDVRVPVVRKPRPKLHKNVKGEITTMSRVNEITVLPKGTVRLHK